MREIKFRGKRKDNGQWVYGFAVQDYFTDKWFIATTGDPILSHIDLIEVDPNTVGQSTGLKDKNGKEIYEGDIVKFTYHVAFGMNNVIEAPVAFMFGKFGYSTREAKQVSNPDGWDKEYDFIETGAFGLSRLETMEDGWLDKSGTTSDMFEIIGNIHDNPELLESVRE